MQESLFIGKPIIEPLEPMDEDSDYQLRIIIKKMIFISKQIMTNNNIRNMAPVLKVQASNK